MVKGKFDPLSNRRTSEVFYQLLIGIKTPNKIAVCIGITPTSAIEHLRRLQKIGIVRYGEKTGKFQHYEIDKRLLARIFIEKAPGSVKRSIKLKRSDSMILENKYFQEMILKYFKNYHLYTTNYILLDAVKAFEESLTKIYPNVKAKEDSNDPELQSMLSLLKEWFNEAKETLNTPQKALSETFIEMDLIELENDVPRSRVDY